MMTRISIVMPVYNSEKYLRACLDSLLRQSFIDFEVICIDDCSVDGSWEILKEYAQIDNRIKVLQNEENLRAAGTRNVGLEKAVGDYIYFIDSDDYIDRDYLRLLYAKAIETDADIVTNSNIVKETNGVAEPYIHLGMPNISQEGKYIDAKTSVENAFCVVWMRLFKRSFLEQYHIRFQDVKMEDNVFHFVTSIHASSIYVFKAAAAYHYVIHSDSVTELIQKDNQRDFITMKANDIIFDYLTSHNLLAKISVKLFKTCLFFKVDTEEKFALYQSYFRKLENYLYGHRELYSDIDMFFAESILSSKSLEDYLSHYQPSVAIAFLKKSKLRKG